MFEYQKNSNKRGDLGVSLAIAWFSYRGYTVSIPLADSQDYDLVVDIEGKLGKVQVKTSSVLTPSGSYQVNLRVAGGNKYSQKIKLFEKGEVDYIFILVENGSMYFIPAENIQSKNCITVGTSYSEYKVSLT